ncbi:restriction endonuclease subunit S [Megamonas hypermegale]|uniref:restriction endonuclease subunit S n=1 Tax=Megamonas hypermegale TaxID=158847 RepID=UPI0026EBEEAE|nr:restriction endonuclease subunit S [Megamonas hypermegale]
MSRLKQLIDELCPNGVEYRTLGEIGTDFYRGVGITREQIKDKGTPCVRYGEIYTTYNVYFDKCVSYVNEQEIVNKKYFEYGDILFAITGERVEDIAKSCAYIGNEKCIAGGDIVVMKHIQNPKYIAYALETTNARIQKSKGKIKSKVVHSNVPAIKEIKIPLPPLEIQNEIVRLLDNFTELTAELTAELLKRKQQYEYYRDLLLNFDNDINISDKSSIKQLIKKFCSNGVEYKTLGEIADIVRGASPRPISKFITNEETGINWIKIGDVEQDNKFIIKTKEKITEEGAKKSRLVKPGDFLLSNSMSFGRPYISKIYGCIHDGWLLISNFEKSYVPDFLYYLLSSTCIQKMLNQRAVAGTVQNLNADIVKSIKIPLPPLEVQNKIVEILDRFNTLANDIICGLPAEIELQKKRYEYFRDLLLTFDDIETDNFISKQASKQAE